MADYYTQASFIIPTHTDEQKNWLIGVFEGIDAFHAGDGAIEDNVPKEVLEAAKRVGDDLEDSFTPQVKAVDGGVHVTDDESLCLSLLITVIQAYLGKFHPGACFGFEWSNSCSKARLDGFGGGAVYLNDLEMELHSTGDWLHDQFEEVGGLLEMNNDEKKDEGA